jgi:hypothetical protein
MTHLIRPLWPSLVAFSLLCPAGWAAPAATTSTFTAGPEGTFAGAFRFDAQNRRLTVDLSGLPKEAEIFRSELVLKPVTSHLQARSLAPTRVFPEDQPEQPLKFLAPHYTSLDALECVRRAVRAGRPLVLKVETTAQGVVRLDVSCTGGKPRALRFLSVTDLKASHRAGQTFLTFTEPKLGGFPEFKTGAEVRAFSRDFQQQHSNLWFNVWRSSQPITPQSISQARRVGAVGFFTAWNASYHQDETDKRPPLRYRVKDLGEEAPWGTGLFAHNPEQPGRAFYAVTVADNGEEDFSTLGEGNTTAAPVEETVGPGEPILQWVETPSEWLYRKASPGSTLTRLIFTRWEAWPQASRPGVPIDYLVVMGNSPAAESRERETQAVRVEPAPVGLHLHCWGGSLNGGYGWWHNAHKGAVLIAANQVPYDWWTGYHEALGTCKTFGDGHVQPFTMNRMLAFLDWAATQWPKAAGPVRQYARPLDLTRVFTAGTSMGGSGAPMYAVRYGDRIAWAVGWVGVHVPEESPQFKSSYDGNYGPRDPAITMPDGKTSPWDYFSDVWWLKNHPRTETGFIIASNGKNDGGIGWPQAVKFARALQETRRPHIFNWALNGHGTRTLIGANFDLDLRTDQSLPAFTRCSLDGNLGTATPRSPADLEAEKSRQQAQVTAGQRKEIRIDPFDGDAEGAYNAFLWWQTDDLVDTERGWEVTVILLDKAPKAACQVDLTPRRLQKFRTPHGSKFTYSVTDVPTGKQLTRGEATADEYDLLTLPQIPLEKGKNRVSIQR